MPSTLATTASLEFAPTASTIRRAHAISFSLGAKPSLTIAT